MPHGITQCYLPPGRGDIPALTVVSGTWKYDDPRLKMLHEGAAIKFRVVIIFMSHKRLCVIRFVVWPTTRILQWRNVNECRLPSRNAHSSNFFLWLTVCVNYSANFYCKIALINRFKLYLIKTHSKMLKNKKNKLSVNKNNVEYILSLHLVNVTWRHPVWHYNVKRGDCEAVLIW